MPKAVIENIAKDYAKYRTKRKAWKPMLKIVPSNKLRKP